MKEGLRLTNILISFCQNTHRQRASSNERRIKTRACTLLFDCIPVSEPVPMKEGLRHHENCGKLRKHSVSEPVPMKEGLRLFSLNKLPNLT